MVHVCYSGAQYKNELRCNSRLNMPAMQEKLGRKLQINESGIQGFALLNNFIFIKKFFQCKIFLI
jgi:hypothetical protein